MKFSKLTIIYLFCLLLPFSTVHAVENFKATVKMNEVDSKNIDENIKTLVKNGQLLPYITSDINQWTFTSQLTNDPNVILVQIKSAQKSYYATFIVKKIKGTVKAQFIYLSDVPISPVYVVDMLMSARIMANLQSDRKSLPANIYIKNDDYSPNKVSQFVITFFNKDNAVQVDGELIPDGKGGAYFNFRQPSKDKK